jgi:hypothetical protein
MFGKGAEGALLGNRVEVHEVSERSAHCTGELDVLGQRALKERERETRVVRSHVTM